MLRRRAGGRTALSTTHYDFAAAELFRSIGADGGIISIARRATRVAIGNPSYESGTVPLGDAFGRRTPSAV